jgi:Fic family protein
MSDIFTLSIRQQAILHFANNTNWFAASDVAAELDGISSATLRRDLSELVEHGALEKQGDNKGARYMLTERSRLFVPYHLGEYYHLDDAQRQARETYNFETIPAMNTVQLLTQTQLDQLQAATALFHKNAEQMSPALHQKELERFVVEFAWKSSKIEGNTYSLLDTEFLLRNGVEAPGKSKYETKMILNHKYAYLFAVDSARDGVPLAVAYIEHIHRLLTSGLGVEHGLRDRIVGISGSLYKPLTTKHQIHEQLQVLIDVIKSQNDPYAQALTAVLGISYLQPFEDGNKRTARVLANSLLLRAHCAPLSYRSVGERDYKEAILIFYEQNSIVPFRKLFVEQYIYAANNYNIAVASA